MKKVVFLLMMLVGCMGGVQAQNVASTPTGPSDIKDGYYVLLAKTGEGTKTDEAGAFVYYNSSDKKVYYDAKGSSTQLLGETIEDLTPFKYFFYIKKNNDGTLTFRAWNTELYWPTVGGASIFYQNPGQVSQITLGANARSFTAVEQDGWFKLSAPGKRYKNVKTTDYVVLNDNQCLGYWDATKSADALFQIYAVEDVPGADQIVTYTYNYTLNGVSKKASSQSMTGVIGHPYHELDVTLPDYVVAEKPSGRIKAEDNGQSIEIVCTEALPFQTSTDDAPVYYYLENVMDAGTRLYGNGGLKYRAAENASAVNDVRNDLWYVTGNAFDGLQFHSVGTGDVAKSYAALSTSTSLTAGSHLLGYNDMWFVYRISDSTFGIRAYSGFNRKYLAWYMEDSKSKVTFGAPGTSDAFAFRMVEPTFTFPMYNGGDGNVYNTFAAPFDVALADDNVKMYKGSVNTAIHELTLSQVDAAPATAGVMLLGENSSANEVMLKAVSGVAALEGNSLEGITDELSDLTSKLILGISDQTGAVGFFTAGSSVASLQANHAYLPWADSQVKGISMRIEGEATSIGKIEGGQTNASGSGAIYDLMGHRVLRTEKGGLYIQNGRKFIVK